MDINFTEILAKGKFDKRDFKLSFEDGDEGASGKVSKRSMYGEGFVAYQFPSLKDAFDELNDLRNNQNLDDFQRTALANFNTRDWTKNFDDVIAKANEKSSTTTEFEKIADDFVANARDLVNIGGSIKKGKLKITDDKKGIFDFSLASLGLYRPLEFYCQGYVDAIEKGERQNVFENTKEPKGVIPSNNVIKRDGIFIFKQQGLPALECERRQKGTTKVFLNYSDKCFLKSDKQGMVLPYKKDKPNKVFNGGELAKLKYASTNKKSYLIFEKEDDSAKYVDIFIPVNYTDTPTEGRYLMVIPHLLIAIILEEFGIKTRILANRGGGEDGTAVSISLTLKDYNESMRDRFVYVLNIMAEEQFTRIFFNSLKILLQARGQVMPNGKLGQALSTSTAFRPIVYYSKSDLNGFFQRYKNWVVLNRDKDFAKTKVINPNFQIFPNLEMSRYNNMERYGINERGIKSAFPIILFNVYYYIDLLAFELNSVANMKQIIEKRFNEDKVFQSCFDLPEVGAKRNKVILDYMITLLSNKYEIVTEYEYADSEQEIEKKKKLKDQKIGEIEEIFLA
tara:strand:- start:3110 stop:4804 length:1695 start_codon:yes stop_codon:yes gene_type:complete